MPFSAERVVMRQGVERDVMRSSGGPAVTPSAAARIHRARREPAEAAPRATPRDAARRAPARKRRRHRAAAAAMADHQREKARAARRGTARHRGPFADPRAARVRQVRSGGRRGTTWTRASRSRAAHPHARRAPSVRIGATASVYDQREASPMRRAARAERLRGEPTIRGPARPDIFLLAAPNTRRRAERSAVRALHARAPAAAYGVEATTTRAVGT